MLFAVPLLAACAAGNGGGDETGSGGSAGTSNQGTGASNNAGTGGTNGPGSGGSSNVGGAAGSAGSAGATSGQGGTAGSTTGAGGTVSDGGIVGDGAVSCANPDRTIIPIDATSFARRACNDFGIQGAWYCYSDGVGTSNCTTGRTPYLPASSGMCLSGTTSTSATAYGAGIGFSLNDSGGTASVKSAYNAQMNNIIGFEITITGTTDVALRLNFTTAAASPDPAPFVALPGAGTYQVMLADAVVPGGWANANAGSRATPASIFDVQLAVPADPNKAANYNYCVTKLKPILAGTAITPAGSCNAAVPFGAQVCGPQDLLGSVGAYAVQNNINAGAPGTQCVQAMVGGATCGGFSANLTGFGANGLTPSSYPSIIYGWQNGSFYGGYRTARPLSMITMVPSTWQFTTPAGGKWNAAYDIWLGPQAAPKNAGGGLELMIWLNYGGGAQPLGTKALTQATVAGEQWDVWKGSVTIGGATWQYLAYQRPTGSNTANFNLKAFFDNAVSQGVGITNASYLLGVQAGYEIWQGSGTVTTNSFSASVN